jgi:hypothetical protein
MGLNMRSLAWEDDEKEFRRRSDASSSISAWYSLSCRSSLETKQEPKFNGRGKKITQACWFYSALGHFFNYYK